MKKLLVLAVILGALLSAGFGVYIEPLLYTLTPLQRYYLAPYILSSLKAGDASATTEVRWLWKVRPEVAPTPKRGAKKRPEEYRYAFATEDDAIPVPLGERRLRGHQVPFTLSAKAEQDGWLAIVWRNQTELSSAQLETGLRANFYDGEPVWRFFLQPLVLLVSALVLVWIVRRERAAYYREHAWTAVPFWRHLGRETVNVDGRFRKRLEVRKARPALPASATVRVIEASPAKRLPVSAETVSKPFPQPAVVSPEPSKAPVQPALWDESKGLE